MNFREYLASSVLRRPPSVHAVKLWKDKLSKKRLLEYITVDKTSVVNSTAMGLSQFTAVGARSKLSQTPPQMITQHAIENYKVVSLKLRRLICGRYMLSMLYGVRPGEVVTKK